MPDTKMPPVTQYRYTARWVSRGGELGGATANNYRMVESIAARYVAGGATDATITTEACRAGQWVAESVDAIYPEPRAPNA